MAGMGKVALNEWLLSGWRTDDLNGRLWALADRPVLGSASPIANVATSWQADV